MLDHVLQIRAKILYASGRQTPDSSAPIASAWLNLEVSWNLDPRLRKRLVGGENKRGYGDGSMGQPDGKFWIASLGSGTARETIDQPRLSLMIRA